MKDLFSLDGRTAVITGASGAIGGAIALGFARHGASLALVYNSNSEAAEGVIKEAQAMGVKARADQVNILDESAIKQHADSVINNFGQVDILVNSAGGNIKAALTDEKKGFFDLQADRHRGRYRIEPAQQRYIHFSDLWSQTGEQ